MNRYETLGNEKDATAVPKIMPKSAKKLLEDTEGYIVYSVVVLKKYLSQLQHACRENRFTLRVVNVSELVAADEAAGDSEELVLAQYEAEEKKLKVRMV